MDRRQRARHARYQQLLPQRQPPPAPPPQQPATSPTRPARPGIAIHFRTDYDREHGIRDARPGDCFYIPCGEFKSPTFTSPPGCPQWDNCDGQHLYIVCPDGRWWNIDGRAGNCSMPNDRQHRCWVRTGKPEDGTLSVGKAGVTCKAGGGSIDTGTYHGVFTNGHFHP